MVSKGPGPVSRMVRVGRLPAKGITVAILADDEQKADLARVHNLASVEHFEAEMLVRPWKRDGVRVTGYVEASIVQTCVVTLEPLPAQIREEIAALFVPVNSRLAREDEEGGEIIVSAEGEDLPEPFEGDSIDVGSLAEEFFVLAIDPYPRKPGAVPDLPEQEEEEETPEGSLQEALKKLQENR
ncbi:DUF177 domain-containing protein [Chelativorans sp. Marseille-P2723]|uniref:YceD family protein n=1 Tax=Chelativorans sp. Marseille-P2723 TaxID=2709133 RepID=UPI00156EC045|nr:DUF177 domain-containing protein [Chelativorans sp. Marseille-P2723]